MKVVRLKKGANDFALANLTLGQLLAIEHCMTIHQDFLSPVGKDVLQALQMQSLDKIEMFGDSNVEKIRPRSR